MNDSALKFNQKHTNTCIIKRILDIKSFHGQIRTNIRFKYRIVRVIMSNTELILKKI